MGAKSLTLTLNIGFNAEGRKMSRDEVEYHLRDVSGDANVQFTRRVPGSVEDTLVAVVNRSAVITRWGTSAAYVRTLAARLGQKAIAWKGNYGHITGPSGAVREFGSFSDSKFFTKEQAMSYGSSANAQRITIGTKVRLPAQDKLDDLRKRYSMGGAGWVAPMGDLLNKVGIVERMPPSGFVYVRMSDSPYGYWWHLADLTATLDQPAPAAKVVEPKPPRINKLAVLADRITALEKEVAGYRGARAVGWMAGAGSAVSRPLGTVLPTDQVSITMTAQQAKVLRDIIFAHVCGDALDLGSLFSPYRDVQLNDVEVVKRPGHEHVGVWRKK